MCLYRYTSAYVRDFLLNIEIISSVEEGVGRCADGLHFYQLLCVYDSLFFFMPEEDSPY